MIDRNCLVCDYFDPVYGCGMMDFNRSLYCPLSSDFNGCPGYPVDGEVKE